MAFCRSSVFLLRRCLKQSVCPLRITESRNIKRWVSPTLKELQRRRDQIGPEPEKPRSTYLEWNYEAEIYAFGIRLGEEFDRNLLKQAMIQREYANLEEFKAKEQGNDIQPKVDNFELIKEGDGIIEKCIKDLYKKSYPDDIVEAVYKYLTTEDMLSHVAKHMGLTDLVLTTEFPVEKHTLANTFKAIVAAVSRSKDLNRAEIFVKDFLICQMNGKDVYEIWDPKEPYEYLMNLLKEQGIESIEPRLCSQSAKNTILANYQVGLYENKNLLGIGWGESIQIAKETAALNAIQRIYNNYNTEK